MPPRTSQQRQESLGHSLCAKEIDGEVPCERSTIAQVIEKRQAGVIDDDLERFLGDVAVLGRHVLAVQV
jgi:hypothetical protein